ncbi:RNA methyltransferase [soil metagenome]
MERISSRQNPLVQRFRELARAPGKGASTDWMLLDGHHLVEEAFASELDVETVAFGERHLPGTLDALATRAAAAHARAVLVTDQVLAAMSPVQQSSGVVAIARRQAASLEQVFAERPPLLVLLDHVQDPGNLGAIIRTAEACGASGVVAGEDAADPWGWKALRGAMGSTFRLPVAARQSLEVVVSRLRDEGIRLLATVPRGGTPLPDCDLRSPSAILLGGEGHGLSHALAGPVDDCITIPMRPPVESLNVAVAAALILYEASQQRRTVGPK